MPKHKRVHLPHMPLVEQGLKVDRFDLKFKNGICIEIRRGLNMNIPNIRTLSAHDFIEVA